MLRPFITALTAAIIRKEEKIPKQISQYLDSVDEKSFQKDLKNTVDYLENPKKTRIDGNKLLTAINSFFINELAGKIDHLDASFYLMAKENRKTIAEKLINSDSAVASTLKDLLLNNTYQQVSSALKNFSTAVSGAPYILVQTPREMEVDLKRKIRETVQKKESDSFPVFQVNKKIIGGLRIFKDGVLADQSWRHRVHQLINSVQ